MNDRVGIVPIEGWVELELLGHRVGHGFLTVEQVGPYESGPILFRFEVPAVDGKPAGTHFYTPQAVYGIHPSSEAKVIEALTPWRPPDDCGAKFRGPVLGLAADDTCTRPAGHDGDHEGLPF
jgi:hypothetical protein